MEQRLADLAANLGEHFDRLERLSGSNIYSLDDIVGELHSLCSEVEAARMQEVENGAYLIALTRMLKHLGYGALILVLVLDFLSRHFPYFGFWRW